MKRTGLVGKRTGTELAAMVLLLVGAALLLGLFIGRDTAETLCLPETTIPVPTAVSSVPETSSVQTLLDINTATEAQLQELPGIGEELARRIVEYRAAQGAFIAIDELLNVYGIGEKKLESIKPYITAGTSGEP